MFCDTQDYEMLFSKFHSPHLGCLIDTEHISVSAKVLDFSRDEMITTLSNNVFAFHLSLEKPNSFVEDENKNSNWDVEVVKQNKQAVVILETSFSTIHELAMTYNS